MQVKKKALPKGVLEGLRDVVRAISNRELHILHYLEAVQNRFRQLEPLIEAFVTWDSTSSQRIFQGLEQTGSIHRSYPLAPLAGIPVAVQDTIYVKGLPTRAGTHLPDYLFEGKEGPLVARARCLGALLVGKTHCGELGYLAAPPTKNPHDLSRSPGASSGACAAAVAAGLCAMAVGVDSGGFTAASASFCGIAGFKPTQDRVSTLGSIPLSPSLDQVAIFTRNLRDMELAASLLIPEWKGIGEGPSETLAFPKGGYLSRAGGLALSYFEAALSRLRSTGLKIKGIDLLKNFHEIVHKQKRLLSGEAARIHRKWLGEFSGLLRPETKSLLERGLCVPEGELVVLRQSRITLRQSLLEVMEQEGISAWICPSTRGPAPPLGSRSTGESIMGLPWVFAGLPVVSIPCGTTQEGLPLGVQLVGGWMEDERLLALAKRIESALSQGEPQDPAATLAAEGSR